MTKRKRRPSADYHKEIEHLSLDDLYDLHRTLAREYNLKCNEAKTLRSKLDTVKRIMDDRRGRGDLGVSDHAVLRYLERHHNLDVRSVREEILTRFRAGKELPDGRRDIGDGLIAIMPSGVAATIVKPQI